MRETLLRYMPQAQRQQLELRLVESAWEHLALLSTLSPLSSRSASGGDMARARQDFASLSEDLMDGLISEAMKQRVADLGTRAQICIDVLVRNLFERTADIGFFATDVVVSQFLADRESLDATRLRARLKSYASKYTVYRDIFLFDSQTRCCARLNVGVMAGLASAGDAKLLQAVLHSDAPYVEHYATHEFCDDPGNTLVYAKRVQAQEQILGVLVLQFSLQDEMQMIFKAVLGIDGAARGMVLGLADADGRLLGSSDSLQLPQGWLLQSATVVGMHLIQHQGRRCLLVVRETHGFQGYEGPGWRAVAMLSLEQAFDSVVLQNESADQQQMLDQIAGNANFLAAELQNIPLRATAIQNALERSVWNGLLELGQTQESAQVSLRDLLFAKTLLAQIGVTARKTTQVFAGALQDLYAGGVRAMQRDAQSRAELAMQILDRNLYERANDCRWWALTPLFIEALRAKSKGDAAVRTALQGINDLYTVYGCL